MSDEQWRAPDLGSQEMPPTGNNALLALAMMLLVGVCVFMVNR